MKLSPRLLAAGLASTIVVSLVGQVPLSASAASERQIDEPCTQVEAIFARGSGSDLGSDQYKKFVGGLDQRLSGDATFTGYDLGTESYGGANYEAAPVGLTAPANTIGAAVSAGAGHDYGKSVRSGVTELLAYVNERSAKCADEGTLFVLGGFSQGAQVVGEAYALMTRSVRDRVVYNALFGDPKLFLPEGEGVYPPACRGGALSPYRFSVPDCHVDNGSLGARKPDYLPTGFQSTTGLWCANRDFVCGSTKNALDNSGHYYAKDGGEIDSSLVEITKRLAQRLPSSEDDIDADVHIIGTGTTGLDVVFLIDSTGSMSGRIEGAKDYARSMASTIAGLRGRVALVEYKDAGDEFVARTLSGLTTDTTDFTDQLDGIYASGGGDTPEALLAALSEAFDTLEWRPGATKAAVVLTDAGFHDPDLSTGDTTATIAARSLAIDPVNVYPVVPEYVAGQYAELADQTSGQVIVDDGDTEGALGEALTTIQNRPVALLQLLEYYAEPGQLVTFDASASYPTVGTISTYEWDFDGDGTFETTTTEPVATHVYPGVFDGNMQVRVTDSEGGVASASVPVHIATAADLAEQLAPVLPAPTNLNATAPDPATPSKVVLSWSAADDRAEHWEVSVEGVPVATMEGGARSVTVTDVDRSTDVEFSVAPMTAELDLGDAASVVLKRLSGAPGAPPTPSSPAGAVPPVSRPVITGSPYVGSKLRAPAAAGASKVSYRWLRNGRTIKKATRATYKLTKADLTKRISVVERIVRPGVGAKTITSPKTPRITYRTSLQVTSTGTKASPRLSVRLTSITPKVKALSGTVIVRENGKVIARVTVNRGKGSLALPRSSAGRRTLVFTYAGTTKTARGTVVKTVTIR